eukprot:6196206-Pleurochrysis_carterae.AAC.3
MPQTVSHLLATTHTLANTFVTEPRRLGRSRAGRKRGAEPQMTNPSTKRASSSSWNTIAEYQECRNFRATVKRVLARTGIRSSPSSSGGCLVMNSLVQSNLLHGMRAIGPITQMSFFATLPS